VFNLADCGLIYIAPAERRGEEGSARMNSTLHDSACDIICFAALMNYEQCLIQNLLAKSV
jgi:hypothetical protein